MAEIAANEIPSFSAPPALLIHPIGVAVDVVTHVIFEASLTNEDLESWVSINGVLVKVIDLLAT